MRRFDCGTLGDAPGPGAPDWETLGLDPVWGRVIGILAPGTKPRPVQVEALGRLGLLTSRRNLIVSAPTNSGKSLIGTLFLLDAVRRKKRSVLVEPLRAVAREKWDELCAARPALETALGCRLRVLISTGDYRLDGDHFSDPLPDQGELLIATPERLDAVLRNPARDSWFAALGAVVADEAQLLGVPGRGATLEYLLTALRCLPSPPRIALLSASVGPPAELQRWLDPCDVASSSVRLPPLRREVWQLEGGRADQAVAEYAAEVLSSEDARLLVFVYQTRSAEALAEHLRARLGARAGSAGPLAYHGQLPQARREQVRRCFLAGECRLVVSTTALALGVNLPATHVCVRDAIFPGVGPLSVSELLQMTGRAGRGCRQGHAVVLVRGTGRHSAEELAAALRAGTLPELRSSLASARRFGKDNEKTGSECAALILARLARHPEEGQAAREVRDFFARSLGGDAVACRVSAALDWLTDPRHVLAYRDEHRRFRPTALGLRAARAVLPLEVAAGFARLVRDLLAFDEEDEVLRTWQPLDFLFVLELIYSHAGLGVRFSERLAVRVDCWVNGHSERAPRLYRGWVEPRGGPSRAHQLLASLGAAGNACGTPDAARKAAYLALVRAIALDERGNGASEADLAERWGLADWGGVEEKWRDDHLWLLLGLREVLDVRCFYFHLRTACRTGPERLRRVETAFRRMRGLTFDLQEQLRYCSPLGPVLRALRRTAGGPDASKVGIATIRKLEGAGIRNLADLARCEADDLRRLGIRQRWAAGLVAHARRQPQDRSEKRPG